MATSEEVQSDEIPPDAWKLERAATLLGVSSRTLKRYVQKRTVPCIIYESTTDGDKPMIRFDPRDLAAWARQPKHRPRAAPYSEEVDCLASDRWLVRISNVTNDGNRCTL